MENTTTHPTAFLSLPLSQQVLKNTWNYILAYQRNQKIIVKGKVLLKSSTVIGSDAWVNIMHICGQLSKSVRMGNKKVRTPSSRIYQGRNTVTLVELEVHFEPQKSPWHVRCCHHWLTRLYLGLIQKSCLATAKETTKITPIKPRRGSSIAEAPMTGLLPYLT